MNEFEIRRLIRDAGYKPARRNFYYDVLEEPIDLDNQLAEAVNAHDHGRVAIEG